MNHQKKRILVLNYEFPPLGGGASPVSYEISKGYVKSGHKVDIVTMHYRGLPHKEVRDGMTIYRVRCLRTKKEICHPWEQLTYILSAKRFLKKHLRKNSYDICHCHFIIPTGILALWLKKKYNLPYIITSHGSDVLGYNPRFRKLYPLIKNKWKEIVMNAKEVIAPSDFLKESIKRICPDANLKVVPNIIDYKRFKPLKKENKILLVSRLFPNKGVQDVLDALKPIKNELKSSGWKVDIVGEGPYRKFLEKKAKENGLQDIVKFHGWIDNKDKRLKELYGHSKIFISASYFESFGITILEALSAGCKVLVSDIPGHRNLNLNSESYFRLRDKKEIKNKLNKFILGL